MNLPFRGGYKITQNFGENPDYYKKFGLTAHEGIDLIPLNSDWDVLCLADGVVVKDEDNAKSGAYGTYCTVWHEKLNKATQYCHLAKNFVKIGDVVKKGDVLGVMGATGNTNGAHLHLNLFETDKNGVRKNKDNGYLGGLNPYAFILEQNKAVMDTGLVKELEEVRASRDHWKNEYEKEVQERKKEREENAKELSTLREHIESLQKTLSEHGVVSAESQAQLAKLREDLDKALQMLELFKKENKKLEDENTKLKEVATVEKYPEVKKLAWRFGRVFFATFLMTFSSGFAGATEVTAIKALVIAGLTAGLTAGAKFVRDTVAKDDYESLVHKLPL